MNVLVLADTHLGEGQAARLVDKLGAHIETADVIIHAGDVTDASVLTALAESRRSARFSATTTGA